MNFGPISSATVGNFGTKLRAITGFFFERLWINLISVSSIAVVFLRFLCILTKGLSSLISSLKKALIAQSIFNNTIVGILFSFVGSSHGQKQLDNVSELFVSSATLGTYEVCLVSLLDHG